MNLTKDCNSLNLFYAHLGAEVDGSSMKRVLKNTFKNFTLTLLKCFSEGDVVLYRGRFGPEDTKFRGHSVHLLSPCPQYRLNIYEKKIPSFIFNFICNLHIFAVNPLGAIILRAVYLVITLFPLLYTVKKNQNSVLKNSHSFLF